MTNPESPDQPECCRRSFGASLKDTAKRLLDNPKLAPRKVASERLTICEECDHYRKDKMQCDICQCVMPIKTTFSNMRCPIDKWEEYVH